MPLYDPATGETIITAHASKSSTILGVHTTLFLPLISLPIILATGSASSGVAKLLAFLAVTYFCVLLLLARRGITFMAAFKRLKAMLISNYRYSSSRGRMYRRRILNRTNK